MILTAGLPVLEKVGRRAVSCPERQGPWKARHQAVWHPERPNAGQSRRHASGASRSFGRQTADNRNVQTPNNLDGLIVRRPSVERPRGSSGKVASDWDIPAAGNPTPEGSGRLDVQTSGRLTPWPS
jgi:hypothetical protein